MTSDSPSKFSPGIPVQEIDASCRLPVLLLFLSAAFWLAVSSVFGFIASLSFHNPSLAANTAWLSYGRVHAAQSSLLIYGFCLQSGLAVALWLLARLGQTHLAQPWLISFAARLWNLGVLIGVVGILAGDATGYASLEFPRYAVPFLFLGYLLIGVWAMVTFHRRQPLDLFPSFWFIVAALFWFPWIFSCANLLLLVIPVRGVMQSVIAWWYAANLQEVWLTLIGLGAVLYFLPRSAKRELQTRELALFIFWLVILFGGWTGVPNSAPLPAWMPALSSAAAVLSLLTVLAVALSIHKTLTGAYSSLCSSPAHKFIGFGVCAFLLAGLLNVLNAIPQVNQVTAFTWFMPAKAFLGCYGFFAMVMFGAAYHIIPGLFGLEAASALGRKHFWLAGGGVVLLTGPLALGGIVQGLQLQNPDVPFLNVTRTTFNFLRVSTLGDLLLLLGNCAFFVTLGGLSLRYYRTRAQAAYSAATAELKSSGAQA